jgi:hypothetical protein
MRRLSALAAVLCLSACIGGQAPGDPAKILRDSAAAMASVKSASATLKVTKGTLSIQGFALVSAKTSVRMPSDSDTVYTVKQQDISFALEVVIVPGHVYLHIPFSPFREVTGPEAAAFPNMAKLFDPATGLPAIIPQGTNKKYIASEQLDGRTVDHVTAVYSPDQVHALLAELNSSGPVTANIWISSSDHLVRKAVLEGNFGDQGNDAAVEVDISNFNGTVSITSPTP